MDENNNTITENISHSVSIEFILLLIVEIPSILCTLLILIYLFSNWRIMIKKSLRNHVILLLVIISLMNITIDLPFTINSYRLGYDQPRNLSFCLWWYWIDYTLIIITIFLTATASVQRHILIFHAQWLHSHRTQWLLHFIPIILCIIYPILFYLSVIVFYQCNYSIDENSQYCSEPCYTNSFALFNIDWILNTAFPLITIIVANIALIIRVIRSMRKIRRRQRLTWKRQRKLTIQLLALSSLYVFGWAPSTVISILESFTLPNLLNDIPQLDYLNYLTYFVCPLQPLICLLGLPELIKSIKNNFKHICCRLNNIAPLRTVHATIK
jgi:hypothetical protein